MKRDCQLTAALAILVLLGAASAAAPRPPAKGYIDLVSQYAAGDRAVAVAGIGALDKDQLVDGIEGLGGQPLRSLRAALMLHTDRRELERRPDLSVEGTPGCPANLHARVALEVVKLLLAEPEGGQFVRRWYLAMTLQDQGDRCLGDALAWAEAGLRWFPEDPELLLAHGTLHELLATLPSITPHDGVYRFFVPEAVSSGAVERQRRLEEALHSYERALAAKPALDEARLRIGRVLWRLKKPALARAALKAVLSRSQDPQLLHLAHLFLGRVHQDGGRLEAALGEYRAALHLDPTSQAAAMACSQVLQLEGDLNAARDAVERTLGQAGRRPDPQPFWGYPMGHAPDAPRLMDTLREEAGGR